MLFYSCIFPALRKGIVHAQLPYNDNIWNKNLLRAFKANVRQDFIVIFKKKKTMMKKC